MQKVDGTYLDKECDLYNKNGFNMYGTSMVVNNPNKDFVIMRVSVNRYKFIREYVGAREGVKLIKKIAAVIDEMSQSRWICAHLGNCDFAILTECETINEVIQYTEELIERIKEIDIPCVILPSVGICEIRNHNEQIEYISDCAKMALDTIRDDYTKNYALFNTRFRNNISNARKVEIRTKEAIKEDEFIAYFMPWVEIDTGKIVEIEALARWSTKKEGMIYPSEFIPVFESNGFILKMDFAVWKNAFASVAEMKNKGIKVPPVSINVSDKHFNDKGFVRKLKSIAMRSGIETGEIILDIKSETDEGLKKQKQKVIKELLDAGFLILIEDFADIKNSIRFISENLIDRISIDRTITQEIGRGKTSDAIIDGVVRAAAESGLKAYVEGIESVEQAEYFSKRGCTIGQGYLYYKPMTKDMMAEELIKNEGEK